MVKTYCDYQGRDRFWYVHISKWHGIDGVYLLSRGDSDPKILHRGNLYDLYSVENDLEYAFEEDKTSWEENDEPYPYENYDQWLECFDLTVEDFFGSTYEPRTQTRNNWGAWYNYRTWTDQSKSFNRPMRPHHSQEEKRVLRLADTLPNIDDTAIGNQQAVMDEEWDAHHCSYLTFSQTIQDYQVLRVFDVEIEPIDPLDLATDEERKAIEDEEKKTGYYDESFEALTERLYSEYGDAYHTYEVGECVQYWLNVKTGNVTMLGKVWNDNPRWCDFSEGTPWEVIRKTTERGKLFRSTFEGNFGHGHYKDLSIHPLLIKRGYSALNAMDWYYGCGEDENKSAASKFFDYVDGNYVNFLQGLTLGSEWERKLKMYGMESLIEMCDHLGRISETDYLTALKICRRNNYTPTDRTLWTDMLVALINLGKDIHNAHYVCPADLNAAHDRYVNMWRNAQEREAERRRIEQQLADAHRRKADADRYAERIAKYLSIDIHSDKYHIFVCPTIQDMAQEGASMNHCVYACGYYNREQSLILFCRNEVTGERETTIELKTDTWQINQCYAKHNKVHPDDLNIRQLVLDNISQFKHALRPKKQKTIINITRAEQPTQVALAA